jgi:hypothetical protein
LIRELLLFSSQDTLREKSGPKLLGPKNQAVLTLSFIGWRKTREPMRMLGFARILQAGLNGFLGRREILYSAGHQIALDFQHGLYQ